MVGPVRSDSYMSRIKAYDIFSGEDSTPHKFLGPHVESGKFTVRASLPNASKAWIQDLTDNRVIAMSPLHSRSVFEAVTASEAPFPYKLCFSTDENILAQMLNNKRQEITAFHRGKLLEAEIHRLVEEEVDRLIEAEHIRTIDDPYAFPYAISEQDRWFFSEGSEVKAYEKFGANFKTLSSEIEALSLRDVDGVHFVVWAPSAQAVAVVGGFNNWCPSANLLSKMPGTPFWGLFVPGLRDGELYKFAITPNYTYRKLWKTDPFAKKTEVRPATASVLVKPSTFEWEDCEWVEKRKNLNFNDQPISTYEVHLGSWKRKSDGSFMNYRDIAHELIPYAKEMEYTHIQLMPVNEHPYDPSWGYQSTGYFAPTSRFGNPDDLKYFVNFAHKNGIGVLFDWVPGHFAKDAHSLGNFDGSQIYAYPDKRMGEHINWGTYVFDYGRPEVQSFLKSSANCLLEEFHGDGIRVDAVASMLYLNYDRGEWMPNEHGGVEHLQAIKFMKELNQMIKERHPGVITIAEESSIWDGVTKPVEYPTGLGFDLKWNMGWMNNTLSTFSEHPEHRQIKVREKLLKSFDYAFSDKTVLAISHDEVVHMKKPLIKKCDFGGDKWREFANLRLLYGYMFAYPGKKLLFMGDDIAESKEWNQDVGLNWDLLNDPYNKGLNKLVKDLNHLYRTRKALHELDFSPEGFQFFRFDDRSSVMSFMRKGRSDNDSILVVCNMRPDVYSEYPVLVPKAGNYREVFNTDSLCYRGSGEQVINEGVFSSAPMPVYLSDVDNIDYSRWGIDRYKSPYNLEIKITVPPLGMSLFELVS